MSSSTPFIRQTAWISIIPQSLVMATIIFCWYLVIPQRAFMYGALCYLFLSFSLRALIPVNHRNGINHIKNQNFKEAINEFNLSYNFFKKYDWVDQYRFLTVLNSNKMSYKEMSLLNIAFCYGQLGDGENSKKYYEKALNEFPKSAVALAGLNMLNSISNKTPVVLSPIHTTIKDFKELPNGDIVVFEDYVNYPEGISNIYCIGQDKEIKWFAELRLNNDKFTGLMAWDSAYDKYATEMEESFTPCDDSFVAYSGGGVLGSYSYETGKMISSELVK